jgi:hypothetical protein
MSEAGACAVLLHFSRIAPAAWIDVLLWRWSSRIYFRFTFLILEKFIIHQPYIFEFASIAKCIPTNS